MPYVIIYGTIKLELDETVMRKLGLRPGQYIPRDMVSRCIRETVDFREAVAGQGPVRLPDS